MTYFPIFRRIFSFFFFFNGLLFVGVVVDETKSYIEEYGYYVCEKHLVFNRHNIKVNKISWDPKLPVHYHRGHELLLKIIDTILQILTLYKIDENEKS